MFLPLGKGAKIKKISVLLVATLTVGFTLFSTPLSNASANPLSIEITSVSSSLTLSPITINGTLNSSDSNTATANIQVQPYLQYVNNAGVNQGAAITLNGTSTDSIGKYTLNIQAPNAGRFYIFYAVSSNTHIINAVPIYFTQYESATSLTLTSSANSVAKGSSVTLNLSSSKSLDSGVVNLLNGSGTLISSIDFSSVLTTSISDTPTASTNYTLEFLPSVNNYSQAPFSTSLSVTVTYPIASNPFVALTGNNSPSEVSLNPFATGSVRRAAYQAVLDRYNNSSSNDNNFNLAIDPNISAEISNTIILQSNVAQKFWGNLITRKPSLAVYLPTQASAELSCRVESYLYSRSTDLAVCYSLPVTTNLPLIGNLDLTQPQSVVGGSFEAFSKIQLLTPNTLSPQIKFIAALEIFNQLLSGRGTSSTPTIFGDGAAKYYGGVLANLTSGGFLESEFTPTQSGFNAASEIDLNTLLASSGVTCASPCSGSNLSTYNTAYNKFLSQQYWGGGLSSELLLAQYGFAKTESFITNRSFSPDSNSREAFKVFFASNFGVAWDNWVKGANLYLQDSYSNTLQPLTYYNEIITPVVVPSPIVVPVTPAPVTPTPVVPTPVTPTPVTPTPVTPTPTPVTPTPVIGGGGSGGGGSTPLPTYTVSFLSSVHAKDTATLTNLTSLPITKLPKLENDGYFIFMGWALPGSMIPITSEIVLKENLQLSPLWNDTTPKSFNVYFESKNDPITLAPMLGVSILDSKILPLLDDSKDYKFVGWSESGKILSGEIILSGDLRLVAEWLEIEKSPASSVTSTIPVLVNLPKVLVLAKPISFNVLKRVQYTKVSVKSPLKLVFPKYITNPLLLSKDLSKQGIKFAKSSNTLTFPKAGKYEVVWQSKKVYYKIKVTVA
jgi:hypothetical protein